MTDPPAEAPKTEPTPPSAPAPNPKPDWLLRLEKEKAEFKAWKAAGKPQASPSPPAERPTPPPAPRSSPPAPASPSGASSPPAGSPPAPVPRVKDWIDGIGLNDVLGWTRKIEVPGLKFGKRD